MSTQMLPESVLKCMSPEDRKARGKSGRTHEECRRQQADISEKEIHRQIDQWLRSKDIVFQHERMDGKTRGTVGWPDFTFVWITDWQRRHWELKAIGCEVKRPGENPTKEQEEIHNWMRKNGWTVLVVHSLQELIEGLKNL